MKKVLMVVGSLRQDSFNRTVAQTIATQLEEQGVTVNFATIADLPLMNQDFEFPVPAAVQRFRDQVQAADGLWIVTPEYNEMIPGGLKNALDWLSRPVTPGTFGSPEFLQGKPVMLTGAGGKKAAKVGLSHLKTLLIDLHGSDAPGPRGGVADPNPSLHDGEVRPITGTTNGGRSTSCGVALRFRRN
ncbi:NADPH-dependent FMN reductase [Levilactobacillus acidifarinae]|nr:NADPH-dependent FMN reductase [Levilactobacillus acidifarinae]